MKNLPQDILNIIYEMYWELLYNDVINEMKEVTCTNELIKAFRYNFTDKSENKYNNICYINKKIKKINENKGKKLLLKNINNYLIYSKFFNDSKIGIVYNYLCCKSGVMRYYVLNDYNIITKRYNK